MYLVVDCDFNRHWYPELVGKTFLNPPGWAMVEQVGPPPRGL